MVDVGGGNGALVIELLRPQPTLLKRSNALLPRGFKIAAACARWHGEPESTMLFSMRRSTTAPWRTRTSARAAALAVLFAVAGCGGGDAKVDEKELRSAVLQPSDLGRPFVRFDSGPISAFESSGVRQRLDRFGRKSGWKARYRRPGSLATNGPLVVVSMVDLFGADSGAERDFDAYRSELARRGRAVQAPRVGDESVATTLRQGGGALSARFFTVAWRDGNVTASVEVQGFDGKVARRDVAELVEKQQRRIEAAAAD